MNRIRIADLPDNAQFVSDSQEIDDLRDLVPDGESLSAAFVLVGDAEYITIWPMYGFAAPYNDRYVDQINLVPQSKPCIALGYTASELESMPFTELRAIEAGIWSLYMAQSITTDTFASAGLRLNDSLAITNALHSAYRAIRTVYLDRYISEGHYKQ